MRAPSGPCFSFAHLQTQDGAPQDDCGEALSVVSGSLESAQETVAQRTYVASCAFSSSVYCASEFLTLFVPKRAPHPQEDVT